MDPNSFYADDLSWLEEARGVDPFAEPLEFLLSNALIHYQVRTYHACRPRNVADYHRRGLLALSRKAAAQEIQRLITRHEPSLQRRTPGLLDSALSRAGAEQPERRVWVGLDDRGLIKGSGHYLIYGSEYVHGVLAAIGDKGCADILMQEGIPTVFVIDLPLSLA